MECSPLVDRVVHPARKIVCNFILYNTRPKNLPPGQMKGLGNGFSIRAPGQNLVPAQPKAWGNPVFTMFTDPARVKKSLIALAPSL
jgi:hypothetical protein